MTSLNVPNTFTSGTSIVAAEMNANFDAIETLVNTTGVPLLQSGAATPASLARPEIGVSSLDTGGITVADGAVEILTGSTRGWTNRLITGSTHVGWDSTNKRLYAVTGGIFLATAKVVATCATFTNASLWTGNAELKVNTTSVDSAVFSTRNDSGATAVLGESVLISRAVVLAANDYVSVSFSHTDSAGSSSCNVMGSSSGLSTTISLTYLGPAS